MVTLSENAYERKSSGVGVGDFGVFFFIDENMSNIKTPLSFFVFKVMSDFEKCNIDQTVCVCVCVCVCVYCVCVYVCVFCVCL